MNSISFSRKELEDFALHVLGVRRTVLRRMSTLILAQLLKMKLNGQSAAYELIEEVRCLEDHYGKEGRPKNLYDADRSGCLYAWVVYKRINGSNYYLTFARRQDRQQYIHEQLLDACRLDFPFLQDNGQPIHYSKQFFQGDPGPLLTAA
jgi:hypothetical protein